jgi:pyruvate kinase
MSSSECADESPSPQSRAKSATRRAPALLEELLELREAVVKEQQATFSGWKPQIRRVSFLPSARNLAAYLAFRKRDVRELQDRLTTWGLSSLGRSEGRILANLDAVAASLAILTASPSERVPARPRPTAFELGERLLMRNTRRLFGAPPPGRAIHVMVTLPERALHDAGFVEALIARGMSSARINCAHGTHDEWAKVIAHVRAAEKRLGRSCRVLMDLAGPRVRTLAVYSRDDRKVLAGDHIVLRTSAPDPTDPRAPFQVQCTPKEIVPHLALGVAVSIDEARLEAQVESKADGAVTLLVVRTKPGGIRLQPEKALNFPGAELGLGALTDKDRADLDFVAAHADVVGYSFVQDRSDVDALFAEIARRSSAGHHHSLGVILKIETERAVRHLPELIVAAAGRLPVGLMIARGDLGVEVGFERLAELQEELLWIAEAAHVPVVWATQVLDRLVRKGTPSRAEISDVVMAQRAECVMLNKGDYLIEALAIVDDVCRRMGGHQHKKTARLRALRAWS